jgi:hypothetical protein
MRCFATSLLTSAMLLVSVSLWTQEIHVDEHLDLLARLSYDSMSATLQDDRVRVCMAVTRDGDYRIVRLLEDGQTLRMQGKMPKEQFQQLKTLLESHDFQDLSGSHGGIIRQESESFGAEMPMAESQPSPGVEIRPDGPPVHRMQWLNADGESPFPASVSKVVNWLKHFEPKDAKAFEYTELSQVCPTAGMRLLHPSIAYNQHP